MTRRNWLIVSLLALTAVSSYAGTPEARSRAILIGGSGGTATYARNIADWLSRFQKILLKDCGLNSDDVLVLGEQAGGNNGVPATKATLENVAAAFEKMRQTLGAQDQFILFIAGHGVVTEPVGKLCLPGSDLSAETLAGWLDRLPSQRIVMINTASAGAFFTKTCYKTGRVLLMAGGVESDSNPAYFAEFFLRGFEEKRADANKDGAVDMLEAYLYAARETANWYHRQYLVDAKTRLWDVRGKETRAIWKKLYADSNEKLQDPANPNDPDEAPQFGELGPEWIKRRVLGEHAQLKDSEGEEGYFLWKPFEFQAPPEAGPGQPGNLAKRTMLGQPMSRKNEETEKRSH